MKWQHFVFAFIPVIINRSRKQAEKGTGKIKKYQYTKEHKNINVPVYKRA